MKKPAPPWARFDNLVEGSALRFARVERALVAMRHDEVAPVLDEVDRSTAEGAWAFGFVAYEAAAALDPVLTTQPPLADFPLAWFGICAAPTPVPVVGPGEHGSYLSGPWVSDWDADRHRDAVAAVRGCIAAGETYQANLTTRLRSSVSGDLVRLYGDLALAQRGAHNAYLDLGRFVIASASPELFFDLRHGRIRMRPMKGTAPRGRTLAEDEGAIARLRQSEKERAENLMIVDLVRNDVARVARTGSVSVDALFRAERFETVHQLVSDVRADVQSGAGLTDVFRALFPCGSVTGAPKHRTMELIRDLEDSPRGVYCGAIGIVAPPSAAYGARFNVAIRTMVADRATMSATYGAGGGITWDSQPDAEYAELLLKAKVLHVPSLSFELLETMRHEAQVGLVSGSEHLARMRRSAAYFGFAFDLEAARAALRRRLAGVGEARVRLLNSRSGELTIEVGALPATDATPVRVCLDDEPIDSQDCWPHHKTTRREPYVARRAKYPWADDVILVNERGHVTESSTANLAVCIDGRWWTPPLDSGCLPGIERGRLLTEGELQERVLLPNDVQLADGLALINSVRGWRDATLAPAPL